MQKLRKPDGDGANGFWFCWRWSNFVLVLAKMEQMGSDFAGDGGRRNKASPLKLSSLLILLSGGNRVFWKQSFGGHPEENRRQQPARNHGKGGKTSTPKAIPILQLMMDSSTSQRKDRQADATEAAIGTTEAAIEEQLDAIVSSESQICITLKYNLEALMPPW
ncbi:hypothetical protein Cgig2_030479 [Carnegiea gigantea]|uniref:Uncharacterized protein n=1 Tax=Carnegiea gigantea TaxID=171969 RepID=A0A9Q1KPL3_9CARY|nr:hypothetical protein Cgig2_030479 [Carnegiea gigantea]